MRVETALDFGNVKGLKVGYSPIGKPLISVIFYYLDGLLIDTGAYNTRVSLNRFINQHQIEQVALTHYHEDHAGNAGYLAKTLNIPVYGHELTVTKLQRNIRLKPYEYYMFGRLQKSAITPLPEVIKTNKYKLQPIHTPGHSSDHIIYHEREQGWVFSGDLFLGPKIKFFRKDEDIALTIKSLQKLLSLDFDKLFCGHNPQTKNPKILLRQKLEQLQLLTSNVEQLVKMGLPDREIIRQTIKGNEMYLAGVITLGDVSYKNLVISALHSIHSAKV